ncbi:MAG: thioredoxin domain-containing protein [Candidatus Binatia bacterium]
MKPIRVTCVLMLIAAVAGCEKTPPAAPLSQVEISQLEQRIEGYIKKTGSLPPEVTLKVIDAAPAEVPSMLNVTLEASNGGNTQKVPLLVSRDGRYFIQGRLVDLTVDPYKAVVEKISLKDQPMRGNPDAKVTIVEYSDFQCPFCSRAYNTIESEVLKAYGDKVRLVYKNFPLSSIHPWAESGALAAACARKQSPAGFWKMYDFLFQNQQEISLDNLKEKAQGVIKEAGLDVTAFDACFDNKAALDAVKSDETEAEALGVNSTPTFFINGQKLEGAVPFENFKAVLDQALSAGGA